VFGLSGPNTSSTWTTVPVGTVPKMVHWVVVDAVTEVPPIATGLSGSVMFVTLKLKVCPARTELFGPSALQIFS